MAVAMETVAWRGGASKSPTKRSTSSAAAWGADAQKLMQMMMGQLHSEPQQLSTTLDLFHQADHPLELSEPELPLPSGWEKCLDLQSGKLYYVQRSSGVSTFDDPRKLSEPHEFLGSKRSEEEANCRSSSCSETATTTPKWTFDREEEEHVELDLNLATSASQRRSVNQTVCTVEMIQNALRRTENATKSSSLSSLTSDHPVEAPSPSTSSSSSTSSKSRTRPSASKANEDGSALVMGACTRCLMYVMLKKQDPRCPRCDSEVPVDFSGPPCKRQRR